ncbi:MAG TPA: glycosyltransferase [Rhodanobacteraceae bacterium]|nr:glycosyltransferase [Rhodanobacteraceae bacterium]
MKLVVFGLSISSSWGNGHATLWRGLYAALAQLGHRVLFFEHDAAWYAQARDWRAEDGGLILYPDWPSIRARAERELADADAAIVTSYCPDALPARESLLEAARPLRVFYDLDSPVTLNTLASGQAVPWLDDRGLRDYELVLSYAGGPALRELERVLGAPRTAALYGHVDPAVHSPAPPKDAYRADLSWIGTYAADRQPALAELFVNVARARPQRRFVIAGAQYPQDFPWGENVWFVRHLPPDEHAAFLCSSRLVLNVTRAPMARMGWCPSGRLFEAAACGAAVLSDAWAGLSDFYTPGEEVLLARNTQDALDAIDLPDATLREIGQRARERTLAEHTSMHRARQLVEMLEQTSQLRPTPDPVLWQRVPCPAETAASP